MEDTIIIQDHSNYNQSEFFDIYSSKMDGYKGGTGLNSGCISDKQLNKQDILQNAAIKLLSLEKQGKIEKPAHLLNRACKQARIDLHRKTSKGDQIDEYGQGLKFIEFNSTVFENYSAFENSGTIENPALIDTADSQGKQQNQIMDHIIKNLEINIEKEIFYLYFREGYTSREISKQFNISQSKVMYKIKSISGKIDKMDISEIYEYDFI